MSLTKALIEAQFTAARTMMSGANALVRHSGNEYTGLRSSVEFSDQPGSMGALQGAEGAVRLLVSDMTLPYPEAGDLITVKEPDSDSWKERRVIMPRYDQTGATVRLDYGERHG